MTEQTAPQQATLVHGLYAIADSAYLSPLTLATRVAEALQGGARVVQYRDKQETPAARLALALALTALCREFEVPLIINDDVQLALDCRAAGVHLGRDDGDVRAARRRLGEDALIGVSCYNELDRAHRAQEQGANYVAFGRFFASRTKPNAVPAGLDLLRLAHQEITVPVVAIGGITPDNGAALLTAGARSLAVIEGLWGQSDVRAAAKRYAQLFN